MSEKLPDLPAIVVDLDGTLVDVMSEFLTQIWVRFGVPLSPVECLHYDYAKSFFPEMTEYFTSEDAFRKYLKRNCWDAPDLYLSAKPYWDLHQALQAFLASGGRLILATARNPSPPVAAATAAWLAEWGYQYENAAIVFSKQEEEGKLGVCKSAATGLRELRVLDDDPEQARAIAEAGLPRTFVFMPERPWTRDHFGGAIKKRYFIDELWDILDAVQ